MKFRLFRQPRVVGIDIKPEVLRIVLLRHTRRGYCVEECHQYPLSSTLLTDQHLVGFEELSDILCEEVQRLALIKRPTVFSLPALSLKMEQLQLPQGLSSAAIEKEIQQILQRETLGDHQPFLIDFEVLPQKDFGYENIYFAAARQSLITQYINCIERAQLSLYVLDIDIYALHRACCLHVSVVWRENDLRALCYTTNNLVIFIVFNHHHIVFYQQWHFQNLTLELCDRLALWQTISHGVLLQEIWLCGHATQAFTLDILNTFVLDILHLDLSHSFIWQDMSMHANCNDFLIALGSAIHKGVR